MHVLIDAGTGKTLGKLTASFALTDASPRLKQIYKEIRKEGIRVMSRVGKTADKLTPVNPKDGDLYKAALTDAFGLRGILVEVEEE